MTSPIPPQHDHQSTPDTSALIPHLSTDTLNITYTILTMACPTTATVTLSLDARTLMLRAYPSLRLHLSHHLPSFSPSSPHAEQTFWSKIMTGQEVAVAISNGISSTYITNANIDMLEAGIDWAKWWREASEIRKAARAEAGDESEDDDSDDDEEVSLGYDSDDDEEIPPGYDPQEIEESTIGEPPIAFAAFSLLAEDLSSDSEDDDDSPPASNASPSPSPPSSKTA